MFKSDKSNRKQTNTKTNSVQINSIQTNKHNIFTLVSTSHLAESKTLCKGGVSLAVPWGKDMNFLNQCWGTIFTRGTFWAFICVSRAKFKSIMIIQSLVTGLRVVLQYVH